MTQLAASVNSTEELWTVDTLPTAPYATVGSETVAIRAKFPSQTFSLTGQATLTQIRVDRGVGGTTAASHTNGSALTPVYGLGGGAGGGGVTVLEDPGVAWQAEHVYATSDRFAETVQDQIRVFEITTAGTSGAGAFADYIWEGLMVPATETGTGSEAFVYLGVVGQFPWAGSLPGLDPAFTIDPDDATIFLTNPYAAEESANMLRFRNTIAGVPVSVFEAKTDGDADWILDVNTGAGFRFNVAADGVIDTALGIVQMTTEGFTVAVPGASFDVNFDPFFVRANGLPTADPGVGHAGELWIDTAAGRVLKVSAG